MLLLISEWGYGEKKVVHLLDDWDYLMASFEYKFFELLPATSCFDLFGS